MKFGLKEAQLVQIRAVFALHPEIAKVIIYGSRAIGNFKPGSDIDLTIQGENLNYDILISLETHIDNLLLPYLFDISIFNQISNRNLLDHINRVGQVFYERELGDS